MKKIIGVLLLLPFVLAASGQTLDITFRYLPTGVVENAFVPGSFNGWGQPYNSSACIAPGGDSQMGYVQFENYWTKTVSFTVGQQYSYKIQVHRNFSGTQCDWLSDPLNPDVTGPNNDSVLLVADPMAFQIAEELSGDGTVRFFSAGIFSTVDISSISFTVNGLERADGLDFFDASTGIFRVQLAQELRSGAQFALTATDALNRTVSAEIGEIQPPIEWTGSDFATVDGEAVLRGIITRLDGTVDPALVTATVLREGGADSAVPVTNGSVEFIATLEEGSNTFRLQAEPDGQSFTSDPITVTGRLHPLDAFTVQASVSGVSFAYSVDLLGTATLPADHSVTWMLDEVLSTTTTSLAGSGLQATGTADGTGEIYVDVEIRSGGQLVDQLRIGVLVESDGTARAMTYAENAAWVKKAVVYEIFPLQFGPTATGTLNNPGRRLRQITDELDYIADMGFNTIWFMPIMRNRNGMTAVGAGYNIIDFKAVDERLGTADDFRLLVDRAHELGIRIVLDITPSHVSPDHPWVASLREGGPYSDYIQTTPSSHSRGQDGRGANLPETWQTENGENFYRKYEGFGDLANLDWDDDDLQAEMLDVFRFWLDEFDVDGFRMDVWWGPLRRYGAERFARPTREMIKRQRPDAWILGEITGTGNSTEVYYADTDRGSAVAGGLDAAYDWNQYHGAFRGAYGSSANYEASYFNGGFWPGPNARYFRFLENHDENRLAYLHRSIPDRMGPLAGMLLTGTGVPMIYAGQEVGYGASHDYSQRDAVNWTVEGNGEVAALYQRLAQVRQQFPAFWTQSSEAIHVSRAGQPRVYSFVRPYLDQNAVVAVNFEASATTITIDPSAAVQMSTDGPVPYFDVFADTSSFYLGEFEITIPAYGTVVYMTDSDPGFVLPEMPALPYGAINSAAEVAELPNQVQLHAAWPNPFNPSARIAYELNGPTQVTLEVFDVLGRRLAILDSGYRTAGHYEVTFDAVGYPSGTYLYRLQAGGLSKTRTMVLMK
ncbi:MAG: glycosidase [Rhodothermales bacterium]|jgi:glycosidase